MMKQSFMTVLVVSTVALTNVACQKGKSGKSKPVAGQETETALASAAGGQLRAVTPGQVQAACAKSVKAFADAVDQIVKLDAAKRTVTATLVAFENAHASLNDQTLGSVISGFLSSDESIRNEAKECKEKRKQAIQAAFSRKELYETISAAVSNKAPEGQEKRLADVILKRMEESGASGTELKDKLEQLKKLEDLWEKNLGSTGKLSSIEDSSARKAQFFLNKTRGAAENAKVLPDLLKLRAEIAVLKGKKSWADLKASEGMPQDATTVSRVLVDVQDRLSKLLSDQTAVLAKFSGQEVNPWDIEFQKIKYLSSDSAGLKEAVDRDAVLAGLLEAISRTFGVKIEEIKDSKPIAEGFKHYAVANPGADTKNDENADVKDEKAGQEKDGKKIPRRVDPKKPNSGPNASARGTHVRPNNDKKRPERLKAFGNFYVYFGNSSLEDADGLSQENDLSKVRLLILSTAHTAGTPHGAAAVLVGNLGKSLQLRELAQLVQGVGRLVQHLFYGGKYASLGGKFGGEDFSQISQKVLENWAFEPSNLKTIAKVNPEQVDKILKGRALDKAFEVATRLYEARVDFEVHADGSRGELSAIADRVYGEVYGKKLEQPATAISHMNGKLWRRIWSEAYAADLYSRFAGKPTDTTLGRSFREALAAGAADDPNKLVRQFLGRDPAPAEGLISLLKR